MMRVIRQFLIVAAGLPLLGYSCPSMSYWPLVEYLDRATVVVTVRVVQGAVNAAAPPPCSHSYQVQTVEAVRGNIPAAGLVSEAKLAVGTEYLIVAALETDWTERQLGAGDATAGELHQPRMEECARHSASALLISTSEVFSLVTTNGSSSRWLVTLPGWFKAPSEIGQVLDSERVKVAGYRVDQPLVELRDYFNLDDVLKVLREQD